MNGKTVKVLRKIFLRITPENEVSQTMWRLFKKEHNNRTHREKGKFKKDKL